MQRHFVVVSSFAVTVTVTVGAAAAAAAIARQFRRITRPALLPALQAMASALSKSLPGAAPACADNEVTQSDNKTDRDSPRLCGAIPNDAIGSQRRVFGLRCADLTLPGEH